MSRRIYLVNWKANRVVRGRGGKCRHQHLNICSQFNVRGANQIKNRRIARVQLLAEANESPHSSVVPPARSQHTKLISLQGVQGVAYRYGQLEVGVG